MLDFTKPDYLYRLARSGSPRDRHELAMSMQDILGVTPHREVATEILMLLLKEAEMELRKELAERLASQRDCPMELIHFLVYESPVAVAQIVIKDSPLLQDPDLLKIIAEFSSDPAYLQAIAQRPKLSGEVVKELFDTDDEQTQLFLLQNRQIELNESCLNYLIDIVKQKPNLQQPFLQRREVPPNLAAKLYWHVSVELRQHILENFPMDAARLDRVMDQALKKQVDAKNGVYEITDEIRVKVERLKASGMLNVRHTMECLRQANIPMFACMSAMIMRVSPESLLKALMEDQNNEALSVVGHQLRLTRTDFNGLYLLWRRQTLPSRVIRGEDMAQAADQFKDMSPEKARGLMEHWC